MIRKIVSTVSIASALAASLAALLTLTALTSLSAHAADVPVAVVQQVDSRLDSQHELQPPIIDASPVMPGAWVYFTDNTSKRPGQTDSTRPYTLDAHLIYQDADHVWHDQLFDRYEEDGGIPQIASVFFAHADHTAHSRSLVVLVKTPQQHEDYGGDAYDGYVYKLTGTAAQGAVFVGLQSDASAPFIGQCQCGFRDGRTQHARYPNATAIRNALAETFPEK
ncbi:hypothetical protein [Paraburkholderia tropica]|uniref:Secreted protein n=1 Tax=Paraburkholderia tropica TaxID=92647 RepID=A0ABX5MH67_9BURK|nr:hypothetical protein [Paraburkholderia tropica]MDE1143344.1 hypothetical protein [Paraburkholderia tropica]PXX10649.1 hypothetical protein C7400_121126 [Paraburkholderia tropica]PZW75404.1 hypothetical protein C7399_121125 [Paraburkholderia tropica]